MTRQDWEGFDRLQQEVVPDDLMSREDFEKRLKRDGFYALRTTAAKIIGCLSMVRFGDTSGHLATLAISRPMQRKGFGSELMDFALKWFQERGGITEVFLYTQQDNYPAQALYRRFGFEVTATTWHYFVPFTAIKPAGKYRCEPIVVKDIEAVGQHFAGSLPATQIRRYLASQHKVLILRDRERRVVGICRFTPSFPGAFPFELEVEDGFDDFISGIRAHNLPAFDYVRVTFTDNPALKHTCESRGYRLHHKLFRMARSLGKG